MRRYLYLVLTVFFLISCATTEKEQPAETELPSKEAEEKERKQPKVEESEQEKEAKLMTRIEEEVALGNTKKALRLFEESRTTEPSIPEDKFLYALLLLSDGQMDAAEKQLNSVLQDDPGHVEALFNLALIDGVRGDTKEQKKKLEEVIEKDPDSVEARAAMAEVMLSERKYKRAGALFSEVLEEEPENSQVLSGYAKVLLRQDKPEKALELLNRAAEADPQNMFVYIDRGSAKLALEDLRGAEEDLTKAIALNPAYYWNYVDRGRIRFHMGENKAAVEDFTRAIELNPDLFYPYVYRAGLLDDLGKDEQALADYEEVVERKHDYFFAYEPMGKLYYLEKEWKEAHRYFHKAYEFQKEQYHYLLLAALSLKKTGDEKAVHEYIEEVIGNIPRDSLYYHVARTFSEKGYDRRALNLVEKSADKHLKAQTLFFLASYYLEEDKTTLAQTYLFEALDGLYSTDVEKELAEWELNKMTGENIE